MTIQKCLADCHRFILLFLFLVPRCDPAEAQNKPNTSSGQSSSPAKSPLSKENSNPDEGQTELSSDLRFRVANESNHPDGPFGPLTLGLIGHHSFSNGLGLDADYVKLHEPNSNMKVFYLDEAKLTLTIPGSMFNDLPVSFAATIWENRTIDMYTKVGGLELYWKGPFTILVGAYFGRAEREMLKRHYEGMQIAFAHVIGGFEISAGHLEGKMDQGFYRKSAFQIETHFCEKARFPLAVNIGIEDRIFDFGKGEVKSSSKDELIAIFGIEVHLEKFVYGPSIVPMAVK
ncbi:MAG: hypothetical protein H7249_02210 [Chitinophagaceae bacterium]|nr:hypothetical protein [Oligoflexus sp.]